VEEQAMTEGRGRRLAIRFFIGLAVAIALAEGSARVAEALGPPALRWYDASAQLKVEQMDELGDVGVVFAGTSMAWQGLDPEVFAAEDGRDAYNAALAGGVPVVMEPWLLDQVVPRLHPGLVVWGLSSLDFSASYGADNLERYRDALETRQGPLAAVERTTAAVSGLVRYRTVLREPSALAGTEREHIETDFAEAASILGERGLRQDYTADTSDRLAEIMAAEVRDFRLDDTDAAAVIRTVAELRRRGIDVVLVELPIPDRFVDLHPDGGDDIRRVHELVMALGERLQLPTLDLRPGFTDDEFVDFTHLDKAASAALTTVLAGRLVDAKPTVPDDIDPVTLAGTTERALAVNDDVFAALTGYPARAGSEMWYSSEQYGHTRRLSTLAALGDSPDVVFIGSSVMLNAAIPEQFTDDDGRASYNVSLPASFPEHLDPWEREVVAIADPDVVVWGVEPRMVRPEVDDPAACAGDGGRFESAADLRGSAFAPVDVLGGVPEPSLFFGDPVSVEPAYVSALHRHYAQRLTEGGGRARRPLQLGGIERARDALAESMSSFFVCEERLEQFAGAVSWLAQQGIEVVVVATPFSDFRATAFPGGRDQMNGVLARIEEAANAAGAAGFIDLSDLIPDDQFRDLSHVGDEGAEAFTARLAEEMAAQGL
jgi:hypothetical protein